ncbi:hypothetical protein N665_0100s0001 [Sinapis alba]|nr:hypothetical protein N665_0100s0001 [Sinapis alba]
MDSNTYLNLNFVDLLQSQQDSGIATKGSNFQHDTPVERKERRSWSRTDDVVLISSWLNTSKDVVVGNEQKSGAFLKRIADYFAVSAKLAGCEEREPVHCKHRWHKINNLELRHDQKWCNLSSERTSKKRKYEDSAQSSTSQATGEADEGTARPPGVKAAKIREDLSRKERLSKLGLLDRLLAKTEPLSEYEECLKKKLINKFFST